MQLQKDSTAPLNERKLLTADRLTRLQTAIRSASKFKNKQNGSTETKILNLQKKHHIIMFLETIQNMKIIFEYWKGKQKKILIKWLYTLDYNETKFMKNKMKIKSISLHNNIHINAEHFIPHHDTPHYNIPYHIMPYYITPQYFITPHHTFITPHQIITAHHNFILLKTSHQNAPEDYTHLT